MTSIGFYEARTRLSELLDQVGRGKSILIVRRGKPAALLVPPPAGERIDVRQVVKDMREYRARQKRALGELSTRQLIEEGRRF